MRRCVRRARCQVLAAEVADWESEGSWTGFLSRLKERGLRGVEYVVSDSHEGLQYAISKVLPTALVATALRAFSAQRQGQTVTEC